MGVDDTSLDLFDTAEMQNARVAGRASEWPLRQDPNVHVTTPGAHVTLNGEQHILLPVTPYPGGVPKVAGSDTSIAAAKSMKNRVGPMQAEILRLLVERSERGMTCDELEAITGWAHQSASARVRELVIAELVEDSGLRRLGRSGRSGRVYRRKQ